MSRKPRIFYRWVGVLFTVGMSISGFSLWVQLYPHHKIVLGAIEAAMADIVLAIWILAWWSSSMPTVDTPAREEKLIRLETAFSIHYATRADWLLAKLQDAGDHWHEAGECLVRPIGEPNEIKSADLDVVRRLSEELSAFRVLFSDHLSWLHEELPEFRSNLVACGYPSNGEFQDVMSDLREHAKLLFDKASRNMGAKPNHSLPENGNTNP